MIEKKDKRGDWTPVNNFPVKEPNFTVMNLREGQVLEFRVSAVNDGGQGKPSKPTAPHTVRDPVCKFFLQYILIIIVFSEKDMVGIWW